jgi:AP-1 complex subunit mu
VNEVFVDVIEKVNILVGRNDAVVQNELIGEVTLTCYLSGMPELRIGLNDVLVREYSERREAQTDVTRRLFDLEDVKFHRCVRISQDEKDRSITFVPPDGQFNLLKYRMSSRLPPIIQVRTAVERFEGSRVELQIVARAEFKSSTVAQNVRLIVPVPPDVDSPKAQCTAGKMSYLPKDDTFVWTIKRFPDGQQYSLRAHFGLPSVEREGEETTTPVSLAFEIPYYTVSGLQVQYLMVAEKKGYQAVSWVRYMTVSGM